VKTLTTDICAKEYMRVCSTMLEDYSGETLDKNYKDGLRIFADMDRYPSSTLDSFSEEVITPLVKWKIKHER